MDAVQPIPDNIFDMSSEEKDPFFFKNEKTCMVQLEESTDILDNMFRRELSDWGNEAPILPHEDVRGGIDPITGERRGGFDSEGRLALRYHGARSEVEPYLPDGTFLDYDALHKDPRCQDPSPRMDKMRDERLYRARYVKSSPDASETITEKMIAPVTMVENIKSGIKLAAERLKIFSESEGNILYKIPKFRGQSYRYMDAEKRYMHGELDIDELKVDIKKNKVVDFSNTNRLGWQRIADHTFKISSYGSIPKAKAVTPGGFAGNRQGTVRDDHKGTDLGDATSRSVNTNGISKSLVLTMMDAANARHEREESAESAELKDPKQQASKNIKSMLIHDADQDTNRRESKADQKNAGMQPDMASALINRLKLGPQDIVLDRLSKTVIDPKVIQSMVMLNQKALSRNECDVDSIRRAAVESAMRKQLISESINKASLATTKTDLRGQRNAALSDQHVVREGKTILNYASIPRRAPESMTDLVRADQILASSQTQSQRKAAQATSAMMTSDSALVDTEFGRDDTINRHKRAPGVRTMRDKLVQEGSNSEASSLVEIQAR